MTLTYETADIVLRLLQILVLPAMIWVLRSFTLINRELTILRERLSKAEARLDDTPNSKSVHELALSVERMSGNLKALGERMGGMDRIVDRVEKVLNRHEDFLLNGGGK